MDTKPDPDLSHRLLEAGIDLFGRQGFEGASTRDIATAAGTTMSSITYHFGGKQGLYLACADHIGDLIGNIHASGLAAARARPVQSAEEARGHLLVLMENFARLMLSPQSQAWSQFIAREQQQPTEAFERLYARAMGPALETALALMALARPSLSDQRRRTLIMNIVGMVLALRLARACISRVMQVDDIDDATAQVLIGDLRESTLALITEA